MSSEANERMRGRSPLGKGTPDPPNHPSSSRPNCPTSNHGYVYPTVHTLQSLFAPVSGHWLHHRKRIGG